MNNKDQPWFPAKEPDFMLLPLFSAAVPAGFPSPAADYVERKLDLNTLLIKHPDSTFYIRVSGNSMNDAGIFSGDLLIIDRSIEPRDGHVILAVLDGEFTVKRLKRKNGRITLLPENPAYEPIEVSACQSFEIWGVVTCSIHNL